MRSRIDGVAIDFDGVRSQARAALEIPGADAVEIVVTGSVTGLTRYARSGIIQNTVQESERAYVRVATGRATASASTNRLDTANLEIAAHRALEAARAAPEDDDFVALPSPHEVGLCDGIWRFDEATSTASPARRAEAVRQILALTSGVEAAGIFETSAHAVAIFSTMGIDCVDGYTRCVTSCLADNGESTGWGETTSHRLDGVDVESVARRATEVAAAGRNHEELTTGTYEVVLEPPAVATMVEYLAYCGFGAKQVLDGESFLSTRAGERVAADHITIADDVGHPDSIGIGFDFEGVPKRRVAVIDSGTATGPVTDRRTARQLAAPLTGHGSGSNEFGPFAANVVMEGGDSTRDELIAAVTEGVLVTRFHYVNILDRPSALLTGMTRDGTFRIRNGEVAEPVHNLRFANSALDALTAAADIGSDQQAFVPEFGSFGSTVAPAARIGAFHFSSRTSH
ncbi:MAG: TldD/PmbA family protein [Actinomycetota bacterium]